MEFKQPGLLHRFVIAGALAIGLFSVALGAVLSDAVAQRLLVRDAEVSRDFVQSIVNTQQVTDALRHGDIRLSPGFSEFFAHLAGMPDVLRANVYTPDHRVLWSSRPELIHQHFPNNPELDEALRNQVIVHVTSQPEQEPKAEHVLMESESHQYIENYVPVHDAHRTVIGVVELYRQPEALFESIRSIRRLVWTGALLGGLFLATCLIGFVRHTERALQKQQRRLVEADALALVGDIAASVAHSIRNPLGAIRSSAELQREVAGDPTGAQAQIMRDVDRIETLVGTMLSQAGSALDPAAGPPVPTDLNEALKHLAQRLSAELARQQRHLELDLGPDLGQAAIDPTLLAQALSSLVTNACEATSAGGTIGLRARRRRRHAVLSVIDNGSGIAPAQQGAIFKPFHTTKPRGFGMGLALVRRVVQRAGGDIHIDSVHGQGTSVHVRLPVTDSPMPPRHPA